MKYSEETIKEICTHLENGVLQKDAAHLANISEDTFYQWMKNTEFSESVEKAISRYKQKLIAIVNMHASKKDGRLALEVLARRWPDEFGEKIDVSGEVKHLLTYEQALKVIHGEVIEDVGIDQPAIDKPTESG